MKKLTQAALGILSFCLLSGTASAETIDAVTQYSYDSADKLICTAVRMNPAVYGSLTGDACALTTVGSYGKDRITKAIYDDAGQTVEIQRAFGTPLAYSYARYSYSADGLKTSEMDANGNKTMLIYDGFDRLSQIQYPSTTSGSGGINTADYEQFGYDNNGNKTSWRRRNGKTISYSFDNLNRETLRTVSDNSVQPVYSGYNLMGQLVYARYGSATGAGITNTYDNLGRLNSTSDMNWRPIWLGYLYPDTTRTVLAYGDGQTLNTNDRDALGRVKTAYFGGDTDSVIVYSQIYDSQGRPKKMLRGGAISSSENPDSACVSQTNATCYSFDAQGRLTGFGHDLNNTGNDVAWSFGYNPAGQIVSQDTTSTVYDYKETADSTENRAFDGLNRDAGIAALSNGYDSNGNLRNDNQNNDSQRFMTYDVFNRLISVAANETATPYLTLDYDPLGRLAKYTYNGTPTEFLYEGVDLIAEYSGSTLLRRYVHGEGTDDPVAWFEGSGVSNESFFYPNYQGSIIATANPSGNVGDVYKYGPYGEPRNGSNSETWTGSRFRYTGQTMLGEARLYYYKARVYDPKFGRFLQTDPIGTKDDLDLYAYVAGDPVNKADPTGTQNIGIVAAENEGAALRAAEIEEQAAAARRIAQVPFSARAPGTVAPVLRQPPRSTIAIPEPPSLAFRTTNQTKLDRAIQNHLTPNDLTGAYRELQGEVVRFKKSGVEFDHVQEVGQTLSGLRNHIDSLQRTMVLKSPGEQAVAQKEISRTSATIGRVENYLNKARR